MSAWVALLTSRALGATLGHHRGSWLQWARLPRSDQPEACAGCRLFRLQGRLPAGQWHVHPGGSAFQLWRVPTSRLPAPWSPPPALPSPTHAPRLLAQDAHELFCALLELLQGEVLAREAVRYGRSCIRASETADPGARTFGFAVRSPFLTGGAACKHAASFTPWSAAARLHRPTSCSSAAPVARRLSAATTTTIPPNPPAGATRADVSHLRYGQPLGGAVQPPQPGAARGAGGPYRHTAGAAAARRRTSLCVHAVARVCFPLSGLRQRAAQALHSFQLRRDSTACCIRTALSLTGAPARVAAWQRRAGVVCWPLACRVLQGECRGPSGFCSAISSLTRREADRMPAWLKCPLACPRHG